MASPGSSPSPPPTNLYGLDREALGEVLQRYDAPAFHAGQLYRWLYARRRFEPSSWSDLPLTLRERLTRDVVVDPGRFVDHASADDGTVKFRDELPGGEVVEAVYMEQAGRVTLCVSSQVGCALGCDFCLTARMGLVRHLTPGEIAGQVALIQQDLGLDDRSFNIVFMGMGEPLHNYEGVTGAIRLLTSPDGFGLSRRRITVSTSGLAPEIERLAEEAVRPRLAVSLNATTDEVRGRLMPVNRKYPIRRLLEACRRFARETGDGFSLEYVLLAGINDTEDDVDRLIAIARGLPAKVNLIPFNAVPGWLHYRPPDRRRILAIRDRLLEAGMRVSIRWSRGAEARAACGQLALLPETPPNARDESKATETGAKT